MKVTYLRLENFSVIYVGQNKDFIEINFTGSNNKIVSIQGTNGKGKSGLISNISPFAYPTSIDERSSLSAIREYKNGYKEIHYKKDKDKFIIKHYYKANKNGSHSVKSYFSINGEELNDNGNVTSFNSLVEIHFGLTQDMMRLIRLGSNVNSFVSLTPARRKEYIGSLIEEIDMYMKIYKKINDDIKVVKVLLSSNSTNLYNCHISDIIVEEERLSNLDNQVKQFEKERDEIVSKISKIQSLIRENNIEDLKRKRQEAEASIFDFRKTEEKIKSLSLEKVTIEQLINKRSDLVNQRIDIQSKINSYRISIDNTLKNIERLELSIKKIDVNNDIESIINTISSLKISISNTPSIIKNFNSNGCTSEEVYQIINKLSSFNQINQMILTLGNKPIDIYLKLKRENKSIDLFIKTQLKKNISRVNDDDIKRLISQVFQDDSIITPNCDTQFADCPYYRFSELINSIKDKLDEELLDDETLRYIQIISNNIDNILNDIDRISYVNIPDKLRDGLKEDVLLNRLQNKLSLFDITDFQEYLTVLREYELMQQNIEKLKQYEHQLSIYKRSGIDNQLNEIKALQENILFYKNNIFTLDKEIESVSIKLNDIDDKIGLVTKYGDSKKYKKIMESTLESTNKLLIPLESASSEKMELQFKLSSLNSTISSMRNDIKILDNKINEYKRLLREEELLSKKYKDLSIILESVSTKKGIPVLYMKAYLGKIQKLANNLLKIIYEDNLQLAKFKVSQETFEIPYIKNGTKIPDVKYASQSEVPLITMALSFALANKASGNYNILLLDEMDAGLDEYNRMAFLRMLDRQMKELKAEQVFIISHNLNSITDIPIDVIRLSDIGANSRLQNIIYENE